MDYIYSKPALITNYSRILLWITFIAFNFVVLFVIKDNFTIVSIFLLLQVIILIIIFCFNFGSYVNLNKNKELKNHILINNAHYISSFFQKMHMVVIYSGMIYISFFFYLCYLVNQGYIKMPISFFVIVFGLVGLFSVVKETSMHFSKCLHSGIADGFYNKKQGEKFKCYYEYNNYWECLWR